MAAGGGVGIQPQHLRSGKELLQLLFRLLRADAHMLHPAAALGTGVIDPLRVAAVVAHQAPVGGVVGQRYAASGTLRHPAALTAEHIAAVAPPVEKEDALLSGGKILLQLLPQRSADGAGVALPHLLPQVRDGDLGQLFFVVAPAQQEKLVASLPGGIGTFNGRSSGTQYQYGALLAAAELGHVPGMIAGRIFRLVASLLLLVQHDEAQTAQRRKDGGPGAQHHVHLPTANALPLVIALGDFQRAVEHGHPASEIGGKAGHHLGGQHDLRHQYHGGPSLFQYLLDQADINQGFSAAGDALEQRRLRLPGFTQCQDAVKGRLLLCVEGDGRPRLL